MGWGGGVSAGGGGSGGGGGGDPIPGSGWATYGDTEYTTAAPFHLPATNRTLLHNNALTKDETQLPTGITSFFDVGTQKIVGNFRDGLAIMITGMVRANDNYATRVEIALTTGGANLLFPKTFPIVWGEGVWQPLSYVFTGYVGQFWANNGALPVVESNGDVSIANIRYTITRTHKAV